MKGVIVNPIQKDIYPAVLPATFGQSLSVQNQVVGIGVCESRKNTVPLYPFGSNDARCRRLLRLSHLISQLRTREAHTFTLWSL